MKRLHAPNEFFRIRGLREGHRLTAGRATTAETPYTASSYPEGAL